jgi:sulfoxide reductase catalytic subunit YedY
MLMRRKSDITENDVTDPVVFHGRRRVIQTLGLLLGTAWVGREAFPAVPCASSLAEDARTVDDDRPNTLEQITGYCNYMEFSTNKEAVNTLAAELTIRPWTLTIEGEVERPLTVDVDDLLKRFPSEERIYRLRCVEGWSMVIPWNGFSLCRLLAQARPTSRAMFVEFVSLLRPKEMISQRRATTDWPYREGLRIDEAMHPLTLLATGLYGQDCPKPNGAPVRIVVPWKYGFKSPKAVTHIRLRSTQPETTWSGKASSEYGFYANVNPDVAHPRWSQRRENRIGELHKRPTLPFNGYAEQVAGLYRGMDLQRFF